MAPVRRGLCPRGVRPGDEPAQVEQERPQATQLVAIEPADGTFVADYPLIVLAAPWVSADARAAAQEFRRWLVPKITAKNAHRERLRHPSPDRARRARAAGAGGARRDPGRVARGPQAGQHRPRRGHVGVDGRGRAPRRPPSKGCSRSCDELSPEDRFALVTSGDAIETNVPLGVLSRARPAVSRAISDLFPTGDEPVYPAVCPALDRLARTRRSGPDQRGRGAVRRRRHRRVGRKELLRKIAAEPVTEGTSVRIFTVAYGEGAGRRGARADRVELGRRVLHRQPEGHQGRLPEDLVLLLRRAVREIGALPGRARARARRDGDRPPRPSGRPRAAGGAEGARRPLGDGPDRDDAVPPRGPARRLAQPSQHRHRARVLRARRRAVHRDGVPRRAGRCGRSSGR